MQTVTDRKRELQKIGYNLGRIMQGKNILIVQGKAKEKRSVNVEELNG